GRRKSLSAITRSNMARVLARDSRMVSAISSTSKVRAIPALPFKVFDQYDASCSCAPIGWHTGKTNIALINVGKLAACWTESARRKLNAVERERRAVEPLDHSPPGARR